MALDEALSFFARKGDSPPVLRMYGWSGPSVSLGAFQKIADIDCDYCAASKIPIVRRPTGGRAILHGDELTYSFSSPNSGIFSGSLPDSYRKLGIVFQRSFDLAGLRCAMKSEREKGKNLVRSALCFSSTSLGEISCSGSKIIGSAQKRWPDGFLQQGSIPFSIDRKHLAGIFTLSPSLTAEKKDADELTGLRDHLPHFDPELFKNCLISAFEETFGIMLEDSRPSVQELEFAQQLTAAKYQNPLWTRGQKQENQSGNRIKKPMTG